MDTKKFADKYRYEMHKKIIEQESRIYNIYKKALREIQDDIHNRQYLTNAWLNNYSKKIKMIKTQLVNNLEAELSLSVGLGIDGANDTQKDILNTIEKAGNVNLGIAYNAFFGVGNVDVIREIVKGEIYKDNAGLSKRIWKSTNRFGDTIQDIITQGIAQGKGAIEVASDLEEFVKPKEKRSTDWKSCYPKYVNRTVDANAKTLARTSMNHAYQRATVHASKRNPFVDGIQWRSAFAHGRTCAECMERDGQIYSYEELPLDHPNGLCTMIPVVSKSLVEVAEELSDWYYNNAENEKLDEWYKEYGAYFANKQYGAS